MLEFVTNRKDIVIGSAMARNCSLVRGYYEGHYAKLYILPKKINRFGGVVDLTGATEVVNYHTSPLKVDLSGDKGIKFTDETAPVDGAAWAMVDAYNNELIMGSNNDVTAGESLNLPALTAKHEIYN